MKPALIADKPRYPISWHELPMGPYMRELLEAYLSPISRQFFGYHLVKLGSLSGELALPDCPIKHQVTQTLIHLPSTSYLGKASELPLQDNSVDTFVLANELDFSRDPHQVLREVNRCIMPDGHLIISGFNPFSLAGIAHLLPIRRESFLHNARFFSCARVKDWLQLLGFEVVETRHMLWSSLLFAANRPKDNRLRRWAEQYLAWNGAIYVLVARKREVPLSPVRPNWRTKPKFTPLGAST